MLRGHPALSRLHVVGRNWRSAGFSRLAKETRLFRDLRGRSYDLIVHLSEHPRGAWLARTLRPRYSVAPSMAHRGRYWAKSFTHLYPMAPRRHMVEVNLDALRRIGVYPDADERKPRFVPGAEAVRRVERLIADAFVQVHPACAWPADKHAALIDRLAADGHKVVVTAAPDRAACAFVAQVLNKTRSSVTNLAGELSLAELGALAARARLFIGADSVAMHLAASMGTAVVGLCGGGGVEHAPWSTPYRALAECSPVDAAHAAVRELLAL
jgi:heptosyltransferase-3